MTKRNSPSEISFTVFKTIIVCTITLGIALYAGWFFQTKSESNKPGIKRTSNLTNLKSNESEIKQTYFQTSLGLGEPLDICTLEQDTSFTVSF